MNFQFLDPLKLVHKSEEKLEIHALTPFLLLLLLQFPFLAAHPHRSPRVEVTPQSDQIRLAEAQHVTVLSLDGRELTNTFNATADRTRLVIVFSPT
ncbi:hypothetical protein MYX65_06335 [Acidobacteria bacterium AH-259-L09]|nr:hypothetical protein [Acidobacteria bacterium AH-259-L09]